jgi:hypothetical protein
MGDKPNMAAADDKDEHARRERFDKHSFLTKLGLGIFAVFVVLLTQQGGPFNVLPQSRIEWVRLVQGTGLALLAGALGDLFAAARAGK